MATHESPSLSFRTLFGPMLAPDVGAGAGGGAGSGEGAGTGTGDGAGAGGAGVGAAAGAGTGAAAGAAAAGTGVDDDGKPLGPGGERALAEERTGRRKAEKDLREAQARLEKIEQANMSEQEKAVAAAKAAGKQEALAEANSRLVRAEALTAAAGKLADPSDVALIGDLARFMNEDGEIDKKSLSSAIDELVKAKPYLAPAGSRPGPLAGGGARPSSGVSINDDIRARAGR